MAVTLSAGVRQALSSLQSTTAQAQVVQNRLATGKKVNSALDNPASFFTASGLNNRASDLGRLLDDMTQSIKTLEAADKGIKAITKLVENAQSIAKQARSSASANVAVTGSAAPSASYVVAAGGGNIAFGVNGTTQTVALAAGDDVATIIDKVNDADVGVKASLNSDGEVVFEGLGGESFTVRSTGSTASILTGLNITGSDTEATQAAGEENVTRANLAADFDAIRTQIDQLAKDAGYNGTNLIAGDTLKVIFNEDGTSSLTVKGANLDSAGLSISASAGEFQANSDIDAAITELKAATDTLRSQAATFGANLSVVQNRQDFTKGMIDTLTSGADALVVADSNEEGASLLALNTRAQLSQTALSLASQQDQAVLRLF